MSLQRYELGLLSGSSDNRGDVLQLQTQRGGWRVAGWRQQSSACRYEVIDMAFACKRIVEP